MEETQENLQAQEQESAHLKSNVVHNFLYFQLLLHVLPPSE